MIRHLHLLIIHWICKYYKRKCDIQYKKHWLYHEKFKGYCKKFTEVYHKNEQKGGST